MSKNFDPYEEWLNISPAEQPADYYRLLGVKPFEPETEIIRDQADVRMETVRKHQNGKNAKASQRLLNEIAAARSCRGRALRADHLVQHGPEVEHAHGLPGRGEARLAGEEPLQRREVRRRHLCPPLLVPPPQALLVGTAQLRETRAEPSSPSAQFVLNNVTVSPISVT